MSFRSLLVLLALITAAPAAAQQRHPNAGDRLRIHTPHVFVESVRRDSVSLVLQPANGRATRGGRALLGALAGFVVSTVAVAASDPGSWDCGGEFCGLGESILIVSGATIAGAIIGYRTGR
ncbi:MAG TPA: hypothetical protein VF613_10490 [Longimicrobium sp.]